MFSIFVATICCACFLLFILSGLRYITFTRFVSKEIRQDPKNRSSINRMYKQGFHFDMKSVATMLVFPFVVASLLFAMGQAVETVFAITIFIFSLLLIGISFGNYFYFKTYNNHYDVFIFGLVEDDTKAIIQNIYDDYPIFKFVVLNGAGAFISALIVYFISREKIFDDSLILNGVIFIITVSLFVLVIRGAIKSKPLGKMHAQVSSVSMINKMVSNGLEALIWAFKDHKRESTFTNVTLDEGIALLKTVSERDSFIERTTQNEFLAQNKPNVVLAIMESFGGNLLAFDNEKENDLLGSLRKHFKNDFVFNRFLSAHNGTAPSVMSLYFYSENQNLSQSGVQDKQLTHTAFKPYKDNGYKVIFITSGNGMWRSLSSYMMLQGVDHFYDQNDLIDFFPEAKKTLSYWGVADEFAFNLAEKLLSEATEPLFINILTISNHPPYKSPKHYMPKKVNPKSLGEKIGRNDEERRNILEVYQYAANALGNFIDNVEQQTFADKTIIAATGDHHIRSLGFNYPIESFLNVTVPFFLHIPERYKENLVFDPELLGSHKDIMPTLYHLSLSDTAYWNTCGSNVFDKSVTHFALNSDIFADTTGIVDLLSSVKYEWQDKMRLQNTPSSLSKQELEKIQTYLKLLDWQTNYLVGDITYGDKHQHALINC